MKANVLVIGDSGIGKTTLVNAVIGESSTQNKFLPAVKSKYFEIHEDDELPFRIIDTKGFEKSILSKYKAIDEVKKWSRKAAKSGDESQQINIIWACVDGTTDKDYRRITADLSAATSAWKEVPVIIVITKSYTVSDRNNNIESVINSLTKHSRFIKNVRRIIPVVASTFVMNENAFAPPEGIVELIDATNEWLPEGLKAGKKELAKYNLNRKRKLAHGIAVASTAAAVGIGANPMPIPDAAILAPLEITMVKAIAKVYGLDKDEDSKAYIDSIVNVGTVSVVAKSAITSLKAIPGLNLAAIPLNAIIAGSIVALLGEGTVYASEQIYIGNKSLSDVEWAKETVGNFISSKYVDLGKEIVEKVQKSKDKNITKIILDVTKAVLSKKDN